MSGNADWVPIIPGAGEARDVAVLLLALADHPTHVRTGGNGSEFMVRQYVADRFIQPPGEPFVDEPDPAPVRRTRSKKGAQ